MLGRVIRTAPACFRCSIVPLVLVAVSCSGPAPAPPREAAGVQPTVTIERAQAAVDEWTRESGPSRDGSARVVAVHEMGDHTYATADLRVKSFPDEDGHISPTEDPAQAVLSHRNDGTWSLTVV